MATLQRLITAINEPIRRVVIEALIAGPKSVGDLEKELDLYRAVLYRHLHVLQDAQLIKMERKGNKCINHIEVDTLDVLSVWIDQTRQRAAAPEACEEVTHYAQGSISEIGDAHIQQG